MVTFHQTCAPDSPVTSSCAISCISAFFLASAAGPVSSDCPDRLFQNISLSDGLPTQAAIKWGGYLLHPARRRRIDAALRNVIIRNTDSRACASFINGLDAIPAAAYAPRDYHLQRWSVQPSFPLRSLSACASLLRAAGIDKSRCVERRCRQTALPFCPSVH